MRELLQSVLDESGPFVLHEQYVMPAVLAAGIVVILLSSMPRLKRLFAALMVAVWIFFLVWMVLDAIETFAFDRIYFYFLIMVSAYLAPSLLLSGIGLILYRIQGQREDRTSDHIRSIGHRNEPTL